MRPIGEALKKAGIGFLVWFEAETANADAPWFKDHPDWYLKSPNHLITPDFPLYLNLGNPVALKAITDQISQFITDNQLTWYRQDFNFSPPPYWAANDTPDRIGMSEIKGIEGLYSFWDELRKRHPGLQIDNCSSGGRRLDIETMPRSAALWRSDCAGQPLAEQAHSQGLIPWVPLNSGVWNTGATPAGSAQQLYEMRSGYSAGMTVCVGSDPSPVLKASYEEFREVRPYFYGDFYPLIEQSLDPATWCAWQLNRTDLKSGLVLCLRRPTSIYSALQLDLHKIDPAAKYEVEVRTSLDKGPAKTISGQELTHFQITIPDKPGSALIFYHKI